MPMMEARARAPQRLRFMSLRVGLLQLWTFKIELRPHPGIHD